MEYVNLQDTIRNLNDDAGAVAAANYRYYCDKTGSCGKLKISAARFVKTVWVVKYRKLDPCEVLEDTTGARISYATPYAAMVAATDDAGLEAAKATANTAGALQYRLSGQARSC